ncbi:MAG: hypothetical protein M3R52_00650 [Acidobacteriota bacterium]|nr:hypothetical protein [Acidobacteriota bacterium]
MKQYTKSDNNFGACKLQLSDLRKLTSIINEGFPDPSPDLTGRVTANISLYSTDFSITEPTLEDFLRHDSLPDRLDKLTVETMDWETSRTVRINFDPAFIMLFVTGPNETWVLGKFERVRRFLEQNRPWFWPFLKLFTRIAAVLYLVTIGMGYYFYKAQRWAFLFSTGVFLFAFTVLVIHHDRNSLLPHTQIILNSRKRLLSKEAITILIAFLSLLVAIIGLLVKK